MQIMLNSIKLQLIKCNLLQNNKMTLLIKSVKEYMVLMEILTIGQKPTMLILLYNLITKVWRAAEELQYILKKEILF